MRTDIINNSDRKAVFIIFHFSFFISHFLIFPIISKQRGDKSPLCL